MSLLALLTAGIAACGGSSPGAHFDESFCPFVVDASQVQGSTIRCGILYTPEVHASPSRFIQVPVLVFKGKNPNAAPVVNLSGGPGQSWAGLGLDQLTASQTRALPMDMVFIEQRGTGLSRPRLDCPPETSNNAGGFASLCSSELQAQGVDVTAYTIQELADDVASFQTVLGYPKIVLDGVSYGTAWGLQSLRAHGAMVGAALLDSVVNPAIPTFSASASATDAAFAAAFAACAAQSACSGAYGDVKAKMEAALTALKAKPLTRAGTTTSYDDNAMFGDAITILAVTPALLPRMIAAVAAAIASGTGQLLYDSDINAIIGLDTQAISGIAVGQYLSVVCTDNQFVTVSQTQSDLAKVNPAFAPYLDESGEVSLCQGWKYPRRSPSDYQAVTSPVTSLLVSGSLDPLTSPDWARQAAATLANGTWIEFPGLGHDEGASSDACPQAILTRFLLTPGAPDTSCVQSMTIAFAAPATPTTVAINAQLRAALATTASGSGPGLPLYQMALRARIEGARVRRHVQQRMAELTARDSSAF